MTGEKGKGGQEPPRISTSVVEDEATERLKKLARDLGLIVNAAGAKANKPAAGKKSGGK